MSGHSEWSNIKHRKERQDKKKAKLFGRLVKEITSEARKSPDPEENPTLASAIERAKEANMPKENIEKAIKRATGELEDVNYEVHLYEGYAPGGVALIVKAETDNRNRTSTKLKNTFQNHGGELGDAGCVKWMFRRKGRVSVEGGKLNGTDPDELQLEAIEAGTEDIYQEDGRITFLCPPDSLKELVDTLDELLEAEVKGELTMIPQSTVDLEDKPRENAKDLLNSLRENDDVDEIYSNLSGQIPKRETPKET